MMFSFASVPTCANCTSQFGVPRWMQLSKSKQNAELNTVYFHSLGLPWYSFSCHALVLEKKTCCIECFCYWDHIILFSFSHRLFASPSWNVVKPSKAITIEVTYWAAWMMHLGLYRKPVDQALVHPLVAPAYAIVRHSRRKQKLHWNYVTFSLRQANSQVIFFSGVTAFKVWCDATFIVVRPHRANFVTELLTLPHRGHPLPGGKTSPHHGWDKNGILH